MSERFHPTMFGEEDEPVCWHAWYRYGGSTVLRVVDETFQEDFFEPLPPSLDTTPLSFVDVETTGLNKELDRVLQLAITRIEPTGEASYYLSYFDPEGRPNGAWRVNNIDTRKLVRAKSPTFQQETEKICDALRGSLLVAHNAKTCDEPMLRAEFARSMAKWPCLGVIDTLPIARSIWTDTKHSLGVLADYLQVHKGQEHDAGGDVETLMGIWHAIREARPQLTLSQMINLKFARMEAA